jgi:hypothetical protein
LKGSRRLQNLIDDKHVIFTPSPTISNIIAKSSASVTDELRNESGPHNWKYCEGDDLHDGVVMKLMQELRLPELIRTHRRTRLEVLFRGPIISELNTNKI